MLKLRLLVLAVLCSLFTEAQNLVPNPSFEQNFGCPPLLSQYGLLTNWISPASQTGSADYFHSCSPMLSNASVPTNIFGMEPAATGDAYVGIYTYLPNTGDYREYATSQLTSPLVAGQTYDVSFKYSLSDNSMLATDNLALHFSNTLPVGNGSWAYLNVTPHVVVPSATVTKNGWVTVTGTYVATGGELFLTAGSFESDAMTTSTPVSGGTQPVTYVYLDDFSVTPASCNFSFPNDTTLCANATLMLDASGANGSSYLWQDNSTNSTLQVTQPGTYWVDIMTSCGLLTDTIVVDYVPSIAGILGNDTTLCTGEALTLDAQTPGATYLWQDNSTNANLVVTDAGTYQVTITAPNGCAESDAIQVNYVQDADGILGNDTILCSGQNLVLDAQFAGSSFTWQDNSSNQTLQVAAAGEYWVDITTVEGCMESDTIQVEYVQLTPAYTASDVMGCEPLTTTFNDQSVVINDMISSWLWDFGDGSLSNDQNPSHNYTVSNNYPVSLEVTTSIGCIETIVNTIAISIHPQPVAAFSYAPDQVFANEPVEFTDESTNATQWLWDFGDETFSTDQHPTHMYVQPESFEVTLIAFTDFCADTISLALSVNQSFAFYVPNAFTPNSDGTNDVFVPVLSDPVVPGSYRFLIFNRWGEQIFESEEPAIGWEGVFKNEPVESEVYVWKLKFKEQRSNKFVERTGHVTVLR